MFDILKNNWNDQSILTIVDFFPPDLYIWACLSPQNIKGCLSKSQCLAWYHQLSASTENKREKNLLGKFLAPSREPDRGAEEAGLIKWMPYRWKVPLKQL